MPIPCPVRWMKYSPEPGLGDDGTGHGVDVLGGDPGRTAATAACWAASSTA